ncbi:hypothetical protein J6590_051601 [Homalodisca vitripennis]|nr:hypothetical protein J6590_051601 [Homalodisca vitripennis]
MVNSMPLDWVSTDTAPEKLLGYNQYRTEGQTGWDGDGCFPRYRQFVTVNYGRATIPQLCPCPSHNEVQVFMEINKRVTRLTHLYNDGESLRYTINSLGTHTHNSISSKNSKLTRESMRWHLSYKRTSAYPRLLHTSCSACVGVTPIYQAHTHLHPVTNKCDLYVLCESNRIYYATIKAMLDVFFCVN